MYAAIFFLPNWTAQIEDLDQSKIERYVRADF
jgi:hypothetical protein